LYNKKELFDDTQSNRIIILGGFGGRLDQFFANVSSLYKMSKKINEYEGFSNVTI
jgi:thiamine pyrophosphokinase